MTRALVGLFALTGLAAVATAATPLGEFVADAPPMPAMKEMRAIGSRDGKSQGAEVSDLVRTEREAGKVWIPMRQDERIEPVHEDPTQARIKSNAGGRAGPQGGGVPTAVIRPPSKPPAPDR